jgi:hypothetical protein
MQGWLAAFSAQPLSFCLYIFATAVLVSCKVIALFLRDGQALKDCAEFHCRSWRLGNPPQWLPNFIFKPTNRQFFHKLQRWPRAVGKLAGDATLGPGQFLF